MYVKELRHCSVERRATEDTLGLLCDSAWGEPGLTGMQALVSIPPSPSPQPTGPKVSPYLTELTHLPHVTSHFGIRFKDLPNFSFRLVVFLGPLPLHARPVLPHVVGFGTRVIDEHPVGLEGEFEGTRVEGGATWVHG